MDLEDLKLLIEEIEGIRKVHLEQVHRAGMDEPMLIVFYELNENIDQVPSLGEHEIYDYFIYKAMANDPMRVKGYSRALEYAVKNKIVLDPGTGSEMILARHCINAGAKKVYAIEIIEEAYKEAKSKIIEEGLEDKIILLFGDATKITLPEPVDYVVSALAGNIASSDGCIPVINAIKENVGDQVKFVPNIYKTWMAGVEMPAYLNTKEPSQVSRYYSDLVFEGYQQNIELRSCLRYFSTEHIVTDSSVVEEIRYEDKIEENCAGKQQLILERDANLTGLVFWIQVLVDDILMIDSSLPTHHLPVYFPLFEKGLPLKKGSCVEVEFERTKSARIQPDYHVRGTISFQGETIRRFDYSSPHFQVKTNPDFITDESMSFENIEDQVREMLNEQSFSGKTPHNLIRICTWPKLPDGLIDSETLLKHHHVK